MQLLSIDISIKAQRVDGGCLDTKTTMKDVATDETLRGGGEQPLIRRSPNGITHPVEDRISHVEHIDMRRQPRELKHLSTWRKRKHVANFFQRRVYMSALSASGFSVRVMWTYVRRVGVIPLVAASERGKA